MINDRRFKSVIILILLLLAVLLLYPFLRSPRTRNLDSDKGLAPRADVIGWIEKHYGNDARKKTALIRLAEGHQYILVTSEPGKEAYDKIALALACYYLAFENDTNRIDGLPVYEALAAESFNTSSRARKRIEYLGRLSGSVLGLAVVRSWEDQCEKPLWP